MNDYRVLYERWKNSNTVPDELKAELEAISGDENAIKERFCANMSFGTAGLRAKMQSGCAFMNVVTVAHTAKALSVLVNNSNAGERGVVIGYDSRNNSRLFAETTARVLVANGVKAYIFDELRPTPVLSFAVRELNCIAGVNITASHNPKQYNGIKVYWEDGAQISPEQAKVVSGEMERIDMLTEVEMCDFDKAVSEGRIVVLKSDFDEKYMEAVLGERADKKIIPEMSDELRIVYSPLNGAGYRIVPEVLNRAGVKNLWIVPSQGMPDGEFPTTPKPNPEYKQVFEDGLVIAKDKNAELLIATDPDADRVGIMVLDRKNNEYVCLSGNQVGALLIDYLITSYKERNCMPCDPYVVKTIVSSELATRICEANGIKMYNVLTGFKYIGEVIKKSEEAGVGSFILGFEESYGYLKGTYARDKDSVVATMLICEMAAYYMKKNMTLYDAMNGVYERYGFYCERTCEKYFEGMDGAALMAQKMDMLRNNAPDTIVGAKITVIRDYLLDTVTNLETGVTEPTGLPKSNVLYFENADGNVAVIRPSGTEPKIKFYCMTRAGSKEAANEICENLRKELEVLFE